MTTSGANRYEHNLCKHNMNGVDTFNGLYAHAAGTDSKIYDGIKNTTDSIFLS